MVDRNRPAQESFDLTEDDVSPEHLDSQVQRAHAQLIALKHQQESIERQKRELEELSQKQEHLQSGRTEMIENFTRALVYIEREETECQRREEMLRSAREGFRMHLEYFKSLDLRGLDGADVRDELTRAISALDDARNVYNKTMPRIEASNHTSSGGVSALTYEGYEEDSGSKDFTYWFKAGLAFTLPLVLVGVLIFVALVAGAR